MVSEWSAKCSQAGDPMSCINALQSPQNPPDFQTGKKVNLNPVNPDYAWTDLTYLLFKNNVSWKYYVQTGTQPDCADDEADCPPVHQDAKTPGIWNPLPFFDTVKQDGQLQNITDVTNFYKDARAGTLPAISWITPSGANSEHPPALVSDGQAWTTSLINAVMQGPDWETPSSFSPGMTGGVLRPCRASPGGRKWLRPARPGTGNQPLRQERLHRPPDPES